MVRDERILTPAEAEPVRQGDYLYLLAPPEKAQALDRFFVDMPPPIAPDPHLLGDFFVSGDGDAGRACGNLRPRGRAGGRRDHAGGSSRPRSSGTCRRPGDTLPLGTIVLVVRAVEHERVTAVGLRLPEEEEPPTAPRLRDRLKRLVRRLDPFHDR